MKQNDITSIYQNVINKKDFEGSAKLIRLLIPDDGDGLEQWEVEFLNEPGSIYQRWVLKEN